MATLWIMPELPFAAEYGAAAGVSNARELRDWLAGDWCLLFSHPEDFQPRGLEMDRWLEIVRDACRSRRVRPLRYASMPVRDRSWTSRVLADEGIVLLPRPSVGAVDLHVHALRVHVAAAPARFVFILDETLQRRGLLSYVPATNRISPLDLLASIGAMRRHDLRRAA